MSTLLPVAAAIGAWWAGTGLLFLLARAADSDHHRGYLLAGASGAAVAAGAAAVALREVGGTSGALLGFGVGVLLWAWHELTFLSGSVTGPIKEPCPPELSGWPRFRHAVGAIIHHELALAATVVALGVAAWGASNAMPFYTFLVFWVMRLSAKLNLFAGVPNPNDHLFPSRLAHLASLVPARRTSSLLPISLVLIAAVTGGLLYGGVAADSAYWAASLLILGTLAGLALLEHLVMVVPIRLESLWGWEPAPEPEPGTETTLSS